MSKSLPQSRDWENEKSGNTIRLAAWTFAWLITTALIAFGPKFVWDYAMVWSALAVLLNLCVGVGMILANRQQLRSMDELEQKIFLDAAVMTLGIGLVFAGAYQLMGDIRLLPFEPQIAHLMVVMSLTFLVGMLAGHRKYS